MDLGTRAQLLASGLFRPLLLGGVATLQRPFGQKLALELGLERTVVDDALAHEIGQARLRRARALVPVDALPPLDRWEWAIGAALNDLLQATNHELSSFATRARHLSLCRAATALCEALPPPRCLEEALARHATFGRVLELARVDTRVSWWTGSASFRGQEPPPRLLVWPEVRRVQIDRDRVPLARMFAGTALDETSYLGALATFLRASPLTDLATADRAAPRFAWSRGTLSLAATVAGANLVLRAFALERDDPSGAHERALAALQAASTELVQGTPAYQAALGLYACLREAPQLWADERAAS